MGLEAIHSVSAADDMRNSFVNILNWYNDHCTEPWFYGVSLTKDNPHSLAAVLNLNVEDVMVVLRLFGLVKKYGEGIRVVKKVEEWRKTIGSKNTLRTTRTVFISLSQEIAKAMRSLSNWGKKTMKSIVPQHKNMMTSPLIPPSVEYFFANAKI